MIFMSTGWKVSSLAYKCVFYRPEHNAKGGPYGTKLWLSWNSKMKYTNSSKSSWEKSEPSVFWCFKGGGGYGKETLVENWLNIGLYSWEYCL